MDQMEQQKNDKFNEEMAENWREMTEKMGKRIAELMEGMSQKNEQIIGLKRQNEKLVSKNRAMKRKMERIESYIPEAKKLLISRALPAELTNEMFNALPLENAFDLLAKMPNGLLARNVRKILKSIEMAMKANKWNAAQCGPKLAISEGGLVVKHSGPNWEMNSVRAQKAIPKFNLNSTNALIAYFEVEFLAINPYCIFIGFCTQQFPLEGNWVGYRENLIGICYKEGMNIDRKGSNFENGSSGFFQVEEVIGIGIAHFPANSKMKCFATCNGNLLGMVDCPINFGALELYPAISMCYAGNSVRSNFGSNAFCYNPIPWVLPI